MLKTIDAIDADIIENIQKGTITLLGELEDDSKIFQYLKIIIESIEKENFKGKEKKELSLRILRGIIDSSKLDEAKKIYSLSLIDNGVISNSIDIIISAASGDLEINLDYETAETACNKFIIPCTKAIYKAKNK